MIIWICLVEIKTCKISQNVYIKWWYSEYDFCVSG
jgi:hypothetical protein